MKNLKDVLDEKFKEAMSEYKTTYKLLKSTLKPKKVKNLDLQLYTLNVEVENDDFTTCQCLKFDVYEGDQFNVGSILHDDFAIRAYSNDCGKGDHEHVIKFLVKGDEYKEDNVTKHFEATKALYTRPEVKARVIKELEKVFKRAEKKYNDAIKKKDFYISDCLFIFDKIKDKVDSLEKGMHIMLNDNISIVEPAYAPFIEIIAQNVPGFDGDYNEAAIQAEILDRDESTWHDIRVTVHNDKTVILFRPGIGQANAYYLPRDNVIGFNDPDYAEIYLTSHKWLESA